MVQCRHSYKDVILYSPRKRYIGYNLLGNNELANCSEVVVPADQPLVPLPIRGFGRENIDSFNISHR